jgi:sulfotransferase
MNPTIHYVAGLPRSGSTLLMNLLGQHPNHHVTGTSGVIACVTSLSQGWMQNEAFRAAGLENIQPRVASAIRGMVYGFYEQELAAGRVVFDKNRNWLPQIELLEAAFRKPVKVVVTVRDVKAIVASFEKLHRKSPLARRAYLGPTYLEAQTIEGRARVLLSKGGVVGLPINYLRDALNRGTADRLSIIPYRALVSEPQLVLKEVTERLGITPFEYDPDNVEQITQEDDILYGWGGGLHAIRAKVKPPEENPWEGVLPPNLCQWIDQEFQDINRLAGSQQAQVEQVGDPGQNAKEA